MFTGIIGQTGIIKNLSKRRDMHRLSVYIKKDTDSVKIGDSISVNGVCLTVVDIRKNHLIFDIMGQTFSSTSFCYLKKRDVVNVERAVGSQSRLDGHFVLGHIDSVQKIKFIKKHTRPYIDVTISPDETMYVVKKGSVAIDGISLTIGEVYEGRIRLYIIPYTLENTNLKYKKSSDPVNIEFDILGKYIQNKALHNKNKTPILTEESLRNKGFI